MWTPVLTHLELDSGCCLQDCSSSPLGCFTWSMGYVGLLSREAVFKQPTITKHPLPRCLAFTVRLFTGHLSSPCFIINVYSIEYLWFTEHSFHLARISALEYPSPKFPMSGWLHPEEEWGEGALSPEKWINGICHLEARLQACYKRTYLRNSQVKEMRGARYVGRGVELPDPLIVSTSLSPNLHVFNHPRAPHWPTLSCL